ncbi:hypothetical protein BABINDRAFT_159975 [Babjeviella inositovora NRRL Y-12698]|uniref:3,4-dihydroxy-2-butanone 4-phosphate synthase n=1 Tax=Babjeviella inositovora NRRL Y-12698 TaxID=984486 RepID=A0A1E3QXG4_9ASCO|nr:uncharacterized protein BABINDRAFT_159975 [Babjeviella inositovora NRRL Y-12698]ODQ81727.1 hypothetical protein BABINDRAFT_159975 [Babjeviella inositovora NRRL Y-12698]
MSTSVFTPIPEALEAFKNGEFLIVMDDEDRENEGDLIVAAENITTAQMAFLVRHSSGYICAPLSTERADLLDLPFMMDQTLQNDRHSTAYTITVDVKEGTTTGISAADRALTCRRLGHLGAKPTDFLRPGHIVPLRAVPGLLKTRVGHTEAAVQLCELTGQNLAAVICELVRDEDGLMKRLPDCVSFGKEFGIKLINIKQLVEHIK